MLEANPHTPRGQVRPFNASRLRNLLVLPYDPSSVMHYGFPLNGIVAQQLWRERPEVLRGYFPGHQFSISASNWDPGVEILRARLPLGGNSFRISELTLGQSNFDLRISNDNFSDGDKALLSRMYPFAQGD